MIVKISSIFGHVIKFHNFNIVNEKTIVTVET